MPASFGRTYGLNEPERETWIQVILHQFSTTIWAVRCDHEKGPCGSRPLSIRENHGQSSSVNAICCSVPDKNGHISSENVWTFLERFSAFYSVKNSLSLIFCKELKNAKNSIEGPFLIWRLILTLHTNNWKCLKEKQPMSSATKMSFSCNAACCGILPFLANFSSPGIAHCLFVSQLYWV